MSGRWGDGGVRRSVLIPPTPAAKKVEFRAETQVSDPPFLVKIAVKQDVGSQKHLKGLLKIDPVRGKSRITHFRAKFLHYTHN